MNNELKYNDFRDLEAWKNCREIRKKIWNLCKTFPNDEQYRLSDQMIRASRSSTANTCPIKWLGFEVYYTYVLQNVKNVNFYTGLTNDLKLRFEKHSKGLVESTKDRRPFKLIYYEACLDQNDATKREKYLKTFHGKMFLRRRFKSYLTG
jgi:putative endonuclease